LDQLYFFSHYFIPKFYNSLTTVYFQKMSGTDTMEDTGIKHLSPEKEEESGITTPDDNYLAAALEKKEDVSGNTSFQEGNETDNEKQTQAVEEEKPPRDIGGWKWALVVFAILSSTFLFALDQTIVADIQPVIVTHFNSVGKLSWLSVAFLIGAASTNLVWGKVFGQFNGKFCYIFCVFLFELGSAVCGAAPSIDALIIGRAICGVGGAGMYVGVMTLLAATTTMHERPMYIGGTGLTWGLGTVLGPIIGGAFTDSSAGWRWAFYSSYSRLSFFPVQAVSRVAS
jgi:hypothetical protein